MLAKLDPRRQKQANLRRAASSAYYALFHLLTGDAAHLYLACFLLWDRWDKEPR